MHKPQNEITKSWNDNTLAIVSIVCTSYNQEDYIQEAIDSFLMQETLFPFEIIIHDDASTDNTVNIIKKYESKYPDIIKPIYQKENQYSKGRFKPATYASSYSKAKYIALCEGDDYWIDRKKLQNQVEEMEKRPEVNFCFHPALLLHKKILKKNDDWNYGKNTKVIPFTKVLNTLGTFSPTPSYMFRSHILKNMPQWFLDTAPVGDIFMEIYGSKSAGALYINKPMSIYRVNASGSWTNKYIVGSEFYHKHWRKMLNSYIELEKETSVSLRKNISNCYYHISLSYLINNDTKSFKMFIKKSTAYYPFLSIPQAAFYLFSFSPTLLQKTYKFLKPDRVRNERHS